jgi:outer membrane receptor protein involved in Fe transport
MKANASLLPPLLCLLVASSLPAQVGTEGSILGVVTDGSGGVIPGAEITGTNLNTGLKKTALTDESGNFEILALPIGPYSISVSATGFKSWVVERTELTVGERKRVSPVLEVGQVTDKVTVEATVELVQTEKGAVQTIVEEKQIRELPLNGRNPVQLVSLVPGVRFVAGRSGTDMNNIVQGLGNREDQTEFLVDGLNANSGIDEYGIAIPNVDTISEFNVETNAFGAEHGRNPLQVNLVTKSGTNAFHGTLWEFIRNDALDARNTFAVQKPKLRRNEYGYSVGGPIIKDRTHFFSALDITPVRQENIYNVPTPRPEMFEGDFSGLGRAIRDPLTGQPFPGNRIPTDRISGASRFFFPYILRPNSPDNTFKGVAARPKDTYEFTNRIDHLISSKQKIYGRWVYFRDFEDTPGVLPTIYENRFTPQQNVGLTYNYTINPRILLNVSAGIMRSVINRNSDVVGKENLTQQAGIQGFPTEGRAAAVGLPNSVGITGYTGFGTPFGVPYKLWWQTFGGTASINWILGKHSLNFGYQLDHRTTWGRHSSCCSRGTFTFNAQYTGDGFADYLLGLVQTSSRNYPLQTFGMADSPYSALYVQDFWKLNQNLTLNLGLRYDYWHEKAAVRGNVASFDVKLGKAIAGVDKNGQVDLTSQPVARFLAKATEGLWIPATDAGYPAGLFGANGYLSPRLGIAWRPFGGNDLVIRGGYGIFTSSFRGNATASAIIGPPYWTFEMQGWSAAQLQRWETAWPDDPQAFLSPSVTAADIGVDSMKSQQWNLSVQHSLPLDSAVTITYAGNRVSDMITQNNRNEVPAGQYTSLQAAKPWPAFGAINLYENIGKSWYDSLQLKWERRFSDGFSYMASYAFSKHLGENEASIADFPIPFAPEGYNRGRSELNRTHILALNAVYEFPVGRGRKFMADAHPVANAIFGGWQISGIYNFISGAPFSFVVPGATLGNGFNTRANITGDLEVPNPSAAGWFNPQALAAPPQFTYGSSGLNIFDGPGLHLLDTALMKSFQFTENQSLQFRWEMFNMPNHVNLGNPVSTIGITTTGRIFSAGAARSMQFGLKFVF